MDDGRTAAEQPDRDALFQLEDELRLVEEEIDETRRAVNEFRQWIGGRSEGVIDAEDRGAAIARVEEQEQLLQMLLTRRDSLQERIRARS
jgi:hypothetical protein